MLRAPVPSFLLLLLLNIAPSLPAQIPDQDLRNTDIPDTNTHYRMPAFESREAWLARAAFLRKQILAAAGLLPLPEKSPVHAEVFGAMGKKGYTIEKVLLETYPGFYLGGNLYRPLGREGKFPAVLLPHGHWYYGRLENQERDSTPAEGINLALQGYVAFAYDMVGYNDTSQAPHAFGGMREALWGISPLGLQLWNSIRAVDFLTSLPDVDAERIAATGGSGGATQTFLLTAVDERVKATVPANMISAIQQGGDDCENAPNLRIRTNNVEIAALMAPRPMLMISATGDWTRNTPAEEFPAMQSIYRLLGAEGNIQQVQFRGPHSYSKAAREAMYSFFAARIKGIDGPVPEQAFRVESPARMLALYMRERPANAVTLDEYIGARIAEAESQTARLRPADMSSLAQAREAAKERLRFSLLCEIPRPEAILAETKQKLSNGEMLVIGRSGRGDRVPAVWMEPRRPNPATPPTLIIHPDGTAWALSSSQSIHGLVREILDRGGVVAGIDAFQTGTAKARRDSSPRFFTTYNQTDDANRVQDILTALEWLRKRSGQRTVNLVGLESGGVWSYFARAMSDDNISLAADLARFNARNDDEYLHRFFVPGLRRAGDFRAAAVLLAGGRVLLHNTGEQFPIDWVKDSFRAANTAGDVLEGPASNDALLDWIAPAMPRLSHKNRKTLESKPQLGKSAPKAN